MSQKSTLVNQPLKNFQIPNKQNVIFNANMASETNHSHPFLLKTEASQDTVSCPSSALPICAVSVISFSLCRSGFQVEYFIGKKQLSLGNNEQF